jgi:hypothetical protein
MIRGVVVIIITVFLDNIAFFHYTAFRSQLFFLTAVDSDALNAGDATRLDCLFDILDSLLFRDGEGRGSAQDGPERSCRDILVDTHSPSGSSVLVRKLDIRGRPRLLGGTDGMLRVLSHIEGEIAIFSESVEERRNRSVADTKHAALDGSVADLARKPTFGPVGRVRLGYTRGTLLKRETGRRGRFERIVDQTESAFVTRAEVVGCAEGLLHVVGCHLLGGLVGDCLDDLVESDLHSSGEVQAEALLDEVGHATLARLGIDTDDGFVGAPQIGGVDREVWDLPNGVILLFPFGEALFDRVLMTPGKRGEDELAGPRVAGVNGQVVALGDGLDRLEQAGEVEVGMDALGVEVDAEGDEVDVSGALAVAEETAFYTVATGKEAKFRGSNPGATVVVSVETDDDVFAIVDVPCEVFNLNAPDVRREATELGLLLK